MLINLHSAEIWEDTVIQVGILISLLGIPHSPFHYVSLSQPHLLSCSVAVPDLIDAYSDAVDGATKWIDGLAPIRTRHAFDPLEESDILARVFNTQAVASID